MIRTISNPVLAREVDTHPKRWHKPYCRECTAVKQTQAGLENRRDELDYLHVKSQLCVLNPGTNVRNKI